MQYKLCFISPKISINESINNSFDFVHIDKSSLYQWCKGFFKIHDSSTETLNLSLLEMSDMINDSTTVCIWVAGKETEYLEINVF